ncbi:MAG: hypothetical protein R3F60_30825 [bacterium]
MRFQVRVDDGLADGTIIRNVARIAADGIEPADSDEVQHAVGDLPDGGLPPPLDMGVRDAAPPPPPRDMGVPRRPGTPSRP